MHTRMADLARTASCYREPQPDTRARLNAAAAADRRLSVLVWVLPTLALWVAVIAWALS